MTNRNLSVKGGRVQKIVLFDYQHSDKDLNILAINKLDITLWQIDKEKNSCATNTTIYFTKKKKIILTEKNISLARQRES